MVSQFLFIFKKQQNRNTFRKQKMDSFSNIFPTHFKDHSETPDDFSQYKLEFLHEHEKSFKQLGDFLLTKQEDKNQNQQRRGSLEDLYSDVEDLFDLQVEIKLRRYTSFENGFMEYHRKVLKISLQNFLTNNSKYLGLNENNSLTNLPYDDIKSYVFNKQLYSLEQIESNKDWLLTKVDQYRILRQVLNSFSNINITAIKDAVLMGVWILQHTNHLVSSIIHENSICIKEVEKIKEKLYNYLKQNEKIEILSMKIAQQTSTLKQYDTMIQTWLYTFLVAKLGYFDNDCFDSNMSLQDHLKALLKEEKREHSVLSDDEDDDIISIQNLGKKRKM